ncbi:MAG: hypothetical protein ACI85U_001948, partial [Candidatus Promineifilaceae bacterium]
MKIFATRTSLSLALCLYLNSRYSMVNSTTQ